jgi:hypothetical protein
MRGPLRMACKQAAYKYDVIGEEETKSQADDAGSKLEPRIRLSREPVHIRERRRSTGLDRIQSRNVKVRVECRNIRTRVKLIHLFIFAQPTSIAV